MLLQVVWPGEIPPGWELEWVDDDEWWHHERPPVMSFFRSLIFCCFQTLNFYFHVMNNGL
jgi:hypothetical protein